jgi:hypothetical protein
MLMERSADAGEKSNRSTAARRAWRYYAREDQWRLLGEFNRRNRAGRRVAQLVKAFLAELSIAEPTTTERIVVERAAVLQVIAENTTLWLVGGDTAISVADALKADFAATNALRALGLSKIAAPEPEQASTLADLLLAERQQRP